MKTFAGNGLMKTQRFIGLGIVNIFKDLISPVAHL
jgi:hypothetical protein